MGKETSHLALAVTGNGCVTGQQGNTVAACGVGGSPWPTALGWLPKTPVE